MILINFVGNVLLVKLRKMRALVDDDESEAAVTAASKTGATAQPAWMRSLLQHCQEWLASLPEVSSQR